MEPVVSYNFDNGWFLGFDSTMTADWNAPADKRWTIPIGLDVGKAFQLGKQSLTVQFGTYYNVRRAEEVRKMAGAVSSSARFPQALCFQPVVDVAAPG